jgi:hypothetical protein
MSNYNVIVHDYDKGAASYRFSLELKVKHFREHNGRQVKTHGGYTAIFSSAHDLVFSAKCRGDEQFSRRKGVLTAIQKMLLSTSFQKNTPKDNYYIADVKFLPNGCNIWIDRAENINGGPFWWLTDNRLGSGLYSENSLSEDKHN